MSLNIKRGLGGAVITALAAGAIALTAAAPASAAEGDRIQGPFATSTVTNYLSSGMTTMRWNEWYQGPVNMQTDPVYAPLSVEPPVEVLDGEIWTFPAVGTTGPVKNSQGQCLVTVPATPATGNYQSVALGSCANAAEVSISPDGGMRFNGLYMSDSEYDGYPMVLIDMDSSTDGLYLGAMTPAAAECVDGLAASVSNVNQTAQSAVVSGTGATGETITIAGSPAGAVTAVVDASGNWTATVTGLATGDNALTVTSSDNCAPVELSVIIEELAIPVAHPAAAAAAGVLGLGALLFGGLRRRNTARI